jgi:hypothetical protein
MVNPPPHASVASRAWQRVETWTRDHLGVACTMVGGLWAVLCAFPLLARVYAHACSVDLAIYAQAVLRMGRGEINPFVPVRNVTIFADHVDPIILLLAPFTRLLDARYVVVLAELGFVALAPLTLWAAHKRGLLPWDWTLWGVAFLFFCPATIHALTMPVHPATWSMFSMVLVGLAVFHNRTGPIVAALAFLFLFREEYPLGGLALGGYWLLFGPRQRGAVVLAVSGVATAMVLWLRPLLVPDVVDYGGTIMVRVLHPGRILDTYLSDSHHAFLVARFVGPFVPWLLVLVLQKQTPRWALLALLAPGMLIRLIRPAMDSHYMPVMATGVLMALLPLGREMVLPRWMPAVTLALMMPLSGHYLQKNLTALQGEYANMPATPSRLAALDRGFAEIMRHTDVPVLTQHHLVDGLLEHPLVNHLGGPQPPNTTTFHYVMVEKAPYGDPWPFGRARLAELEAQWRADPATVVLQDDAHVFVAQGVFREDR